MLPPPPLAFGIAYYFEGSNFGGAYFRNLTECQFIPNYWTAAVIETNIFKKIIAKIHLRSHRSPSITNISFGILRVFERIYFGQLLGTI